MCFSLFIFRIRTNTHRSNYKLRIHASFVSVWHIHTYKGTDTGTGTSTATYTRRRKRTHMNQRKLASQVKACTEQQCVLLNDCVCSGLRWWHHEWESKQEWMWVCECERECISHAMQSDRKQDCGLCLWTLFTTEQKVKLSIFTLESLFLTKFQPWIFSDGSRDIFLSLSLSFIHLNNLCSYYRFDLGDGIVLKHF